jgi:hypothetical protein
MTISRAAAITAAASVHLALCSMALETFAAASPLRWWVVAAVAAYFAGGVVAYRLRLRALERFDPASVAMAGCILTVGMLVVTAWTPMGLINGIRLATLSTSTLLTLVTLSGIAVAGLSIATAPGLPLWLRWPATALVAYAGVAFVTALLNGTDYVALFSGHGFWTRLPRSLQGPLVGILGVMPLAVLFELWAARQSRAEGLSPAPHVRRSIALGLAILLALPAGFVSDVVDVRTARGAPAAPVGPPKDAVQIAASVRTAADGLIDHLTGKAGLTPAALADRLEVTLNELQHVAEQLPRDRVDPAVIVKRVGSEPEKLLHWVRSETKLVPYRGVLRGAAGVLMDRVGNSLDRSLLLAELIARGNGEARLAHLQLPLDAVTTLAELSSRPDQTSASATPLDAVRESQFVSSYAARFGGDAAEHEAILTTHREATEAAGRALVDRALLQSNLVLRLAEGFLARPPTALDEVERAGLEDHWWVQAKVGDRWTNLDPSGVVDRDDEHRVPDGTMDPTRLDDNLHHRVTVRVLITCLCDGQLQEKVVLEHSFPVSSVLGVPIRLLNVPVEGAALDPKLLTSPTAGPGLVEWLSNQSEWLPILMVGAEQLTAQRFTRAGQVLSGAREPAAAGIVGALGGGDEDDSTRAGALVGQWLEFEISVPGTAPQIERRAIFDWTDQDGIAVTRDWTHGALDMMTETEIVVLGAQPSAEYVALQSAAVALRGRAELLRTLRAPPGNVAPAGPPAESTSIEPSLVLYQFALARWAWSSSARQGRIFLSEPNIITRHLGLVRGAEGLPHRWTALDIVSNRVGVLPLGATDRSQVRVSQGVFDTNLEVLFDSEDVIDVPSSPANVAEAMVKGARLQRVSSSDRLTNRFARDAVASGKVVLTTDGGSSWWQLDPVTGTTLGRTVRGWGGTSGPETAATTKLTGINSMRLVARLYLTILCVSQVMIKHTLQGISGRKAARLVRAQGAPQATGDQAPGGAGVAMGIALCTVGHGLSGYGTYLGGALGSRFSLAGDIVSMVMSFWSVYDTYHALLAILAADA